MSSNALTPDDVESNSVNQLLGAITDNDTLEVVRIAIRSLQTAIMHSDVNSPASVRSSLSGWWRAIGTILETAGQSLPATQTLSLIEMLPTVFGDAKASLDSVLLANNFDFSSKDTIMIYSGLYLAYTSVVRCCMDLVAVQADPVLAYDLIVGIESVLPMDNKGISNVYKKVRSVETPSDETRGDAEMRSSSDFASAMELASDELHKSYDKFWTMIHASRRMDPEMLTDTKSWGRFSQAASATLSVLVEHAGENLESLGAVSSLDPSEYLEDMNSFPLQLSSASFRRRAMLDILFTCSYVVNNSTNAIITAGARNLYGNVLKSFPQKLFNSIDTLMRFESHWLAWKSSVHSKEVCGPFEPLSRIERGLEPFDGPQLEAEEESDEEIIDSTTPLISTPDISGPTRVLSSSSPDLPHKENIKNLMSDYRQYVRDAILCDISDEQELERLSASDKGMEEAMSKNGDRVFLWQFKRMRFVTDVLSFVKEEEEKKSDPPVSGDVEMDESSFRQEEPQPTEEEYVVVPDHE